MSRPEPSRPERNAGAFLGPSRPVPVPMRTLSDDYRDEPTEPVEEPEPEPEPPGLFRRMIERLARRTAPRR